MTSGEWRNEAKFSRRFYSQRGTGHFFSIVFSELPHDDVSTSLSCEALSLPFMTATRRISSFSWCDRDTRSCRLTSAQCGTSHRASPHRRACIMTSATTCLHTAQRVRPSRLHDRTWRSTFDIFWQPSSWHPMVRHLTACTRLWTHFWIAWRDVSSERRRCCFSSIVPVRSMSSILWLWPNCLKHVWQRLKSWKIT